MRHAPRILTGNCVLVPRVAPAGEEKLSEECTVGEEAEMEAEAVVMGEEDEHQQQQQQQQ